MGNSNSNSIVPTSNPSDKNRRVLSQQPSTQMNDRKLNEAMKICFEYLPQLLRGETVIIPVIYSEVIDDLFFRSMDKSMMIRKYKIGDELRLKIDLECMRTFYNSLLYKKEDIQSFLEWTVHWLIEYGNEINSIPGNINGLYGIHESDHTYWSYGFIPHLRELSLFFGAQDDLAADYRSVLEDQIDLTHNGKPSDILWESNVRTKLMDTLVQVFGKTTRHFRNIMLHMLANNDSREWGNLEMFVRILRFPYQSAESINGKLSVEQLDLMANYENQQHEQSAMMLIDDLESFKLILSKTKNQAQHIDTSLSRWHQVYEWLDRLIQQLQKELDKGNSKNPKIEIDNQQPVRKVKIVKRYDN